MQKVHRHGDKRSCGATTEAQGYSNVFVNNQPISVDRDPNVGNKLVVVVPNDSDADALCPIPGHCNPKSDSGSPDVYIGQ